MDLSRQSNVSAFEYSSVGKESACSAGDPGSIPGSRRSPGEGNGNPLQYSCLKNPMEKKKKKNPMDKGAWQATVPGITRVRHDLATITTTRSLITPFGDLVL